MIVAPSLAAEAEGLVTASSLRVAHVLIDSLVPETGRVGFVGQDSEASGRAAGRLLELLCPAGGRVVAVRSLPASRHIELRMKGVTALSLRRGTDDLPGGRPGLRRPNRQQQQPSRSSREARRAGRLVRVQLKCIHSRRAPQRARRRAHRRGGRLAPSTDRRL